MFLWPGVRSYTRQPLAELHVLGSPPLVEAVLAAICRAGARPAEPGEFTLRAFLAGRIDLTQAEAVLGVIDARGENEFSAALAQLAGGLGHPLTQLRDNLLQLLAELEAGLDFVDEGVHFIGTDEILARLDAARRMLEEIIRQMIQRASTERLTQVALVGPPNVGKSSLFNALVARRPPVNFDHAAHHSSALVSPVRGTTRDYLTAKVRLAGTACELVDTAGVERDRQLACDSTALDGTIDAAAQVLAARQRERALVRVFCVDGTASAAGLELIAAARPLDPARDLVVATKADLLASAGAISNENSPIAVSSVTGEGLEELARRIGWLLCGEAAVGHAEAVGATAERCRESVRRASEAIERAAANVRQVAGDELTAAEIRAAVHELGCVVGAVFTDDLLDRIFSTFCIGK